MEFPSKDVLLEGKQFSVKQNFLFGSREHIMDMLKDPTVGNWHVLAPLGKSLAFSENMIGKQISRCSVPHKNNYTKCLPLQVTRSVKWFVLTP